MNHDTRDPASGYRNGSAWPTGQRKELGLALHPSHPRRAWVVVQQPKTEPYRLAFDGRTGDFVATGDVSTLHARGFDGVFGWVEGLRGPRGLDLGAFVLTAADPEPGELLEVGVHGLRLDGGGASLLAIDVRATPSYGMADLHDLPVPVRLLLDALPAEHAGEERWLDGPAARDHLRRLCHNGKSDWLHAWSHVDDDDWDVEPAADGASSRRRRDPWSW